MKNIREISEQVRDHLTQQRARSMFNNARSCAYRGADGNMCAIGCLINDDVYASFNDADEGSLSINALEWTSATASAVMLAVHTSVGLNVNEGDLEALRLWQQYHDTKATFSAPHREFSYREWLEKAEGSKSPAQMHDAVMVYLEQARLRKISLKIRNHLTKQNAQSKFLGNANCAYRGAEGRMCAVGCLITDEVYAAVESDGETHVENRCAGHPAVKQAIQESLKLKSFGSRLEIKLLEAWQQYHDDYYYTEKQSFNYGEWVKDSADKNSPDAFHSAIMNTLVSDQ